MDNESKVRSRGSIGQLPGGSWRLRIQCGDQRWNRTFPTEAEAIARRDEVLAKLRAGTHQIMGGKIVPAEWKETVRKRNRDLVRFLRTLADLVERSGNDVDADECVRFALQKCGMPIPTTDAPRRESLIYFVQRESGGQIKIGRTNDIEKRVSQLAVSVTEPLVVLATLVGGPTKERSIHHRFKSCRAHGEWFEPTPELMAFIESMRAT